MKIFSSGIKMKTKKISLREIMEDDHSPMMAELIRKFEQQYGEELERIMETMGKESGREGWRN